MELEPDREVGQIASATYLKGAMEGLDGPSKLIAQDYNRYQTGG